MAGCHDEHKAISGDMAAGQVAGNCRCLDEAKLDLPGPQRRDHTLGVGDAQVDRWFTSPSAELSEPGRGQVLRDRLAGPDAQPFGCLCGQRLATGRQGIAGLDDDPTPPGDQAPVVSQSGAAGAPIKELETQLALQDLDALTRGRLADLLGSGRGRDAAKIRDEGEHPERLEVQTRPMRHHVPLQLGQRGPLQTIPDMTFLHGYSRLL